MKKVKFIKSDVREEKGSIELIVIGLIAALIIVLAIPLLEDIGSSTESALSNLNDSM